jgi:hypothetical protein
VPPGLTIRGRIGPVGRVCAVVAFVVACATSTARAAGEYRTFEVESLKVVVDSEWGARTAPGYLPVRVDITNLGDARVIEFVVDGSRFFRGRRSMGAGEIDVTQRIRLARGDRVRLTVPVPIFGTNENLRFEIRENGKTLERAGYSGFQSAAAPADASALIVADRANPTGAIMSGWVRPMVAPGVTVYAGGGGLPSRAPGAGPLSSGPPNDFVLPPSRLPTNWLGYTSLRAVIVGPAEWGQLTEAQKSALMTWTACGGDLVLVEADPEPVIGGAPTAAAPPGQGSARAYFFGRIHRPPAAWIAATGLAAFLVNAQKLQDSNLALPANGARDWGTIAERGFRLPIPGIGGVPARAYVLILIVFSLIIGPANAWFLRRHRQQVLLVLTAPLISVAFILLLAGYVVASEGNGIRGRIASFTMLDQARSQAVTRSSLSLYAAGLMPSGELRLPRDVAMFPIGTEGAGTRESLVLDLTETQRFAGGVLQTRSPVNMEQVAFRSARERLTFSGSGAQTTVVNGLGAAVTALVYRDGDTLYSLTDRLPSGGKATLRAGAANAAGAVPAGLPLSSRFLHLAQHQPAGSYLAVVDRSPFVEPGVPGVEERGSFHLVLGWPGGQP